MLQGLSQLVTNQEVHPTIIFLMLELVTFSLKRGLLTTMPKQKEFILEKKLLNHDTKNYNMGLF